MSCYMKMYCSIRGSQAWNSNDSRVAKRMALLVFTDFACWAPIAFFSLTAAFGYDLISLNDAKVFTIFVLPLNSCANPFLYAIFTKQFKKDCSIICKKLEESALSRSLSRFSNRNISMSWGTSRRPSALNSFFVDRRYCSRSRSNSISGASASHHDHSHSGVSAGSEARVLLHSNCHFKKLNTEDNNIPVLVTNYMMAPSHAVCNGHMYGCKENNAKHSSPNRKNMCACHKGPSGLRVPGRGVPVGAGSGLLSLLRFKKDVDKMGDGADSDQEDSAHSMVSVNGRDPRDYMGLFPLLPGGHGSPEPGGGGGGRRPLSARRGLHKARSYSPASLDIDSPIPSPRTKPVKHVRIKSAPTTPSSMSSKRSMNLNCCHGNEKSTKSPGTEYQPMRSTDDSSSFANNSSSFANDSSVFENNIRKTTDSESDYLNHGTDNNNHEYMNITQEMINELQRMRNESATSDENSTERAAGSGNDQQEVEVEAEVTAELNDNRTVVEILNTREDDRRVEPEGSESKEKLNVVKLDPLSALPMSKRCMCNNPNCTDKLGERTPQDRTLTPSPDPLTMNRDVWIGSTERNLASPEDGACRGGFGVGVGSYTMYGSGGNIAPADRRKHFTKKKSCSVDNDVLELPPDDPYGRDASSSMPVLSIIDPCDRKSKNADGSAQSQGRNGFLPYLNDFKSPCGANTNSETLISNLDSCNVPLNLLQQKIHHPRTMNFSDSKLSTIPKSCDQSCNELMMGGSLGFLSLSMPEAPEDNTVSRDFKNSQGSAICSPATSRGSHCSLNSPGNKSEQGLFRSLHIGGRVSPTTPELLRVSPTTPELLRTEVRLTDSIPKVVLKQPSQEDLEQKSEESQI